VLQDHAFRLLGIAMDHGLGDPDVLLVTVPQPVRVPRLDPHDQAVVLVPSPSIARTDSRLPWNRPWANSPERIRLLISA
jgi:hypothetical protein